VCNNLTTRDLDLDTWEKAVIALKYMHAAGMLQYDAAYGTEDVSCRRNGVPQALHSIVAACDVVMATQIGPAGCVEVLELARNLQRQLAEGRPSPKIRSSETVFHWEV